MKLCLKSAVTLSLIVPVISQGLISFNTNVKCRDCCGDGISLYGRVNLCVEKEWCKDGVWATRGGQLQSFDWTGTGYENATFARIYPNGVSNSIRRCTVQGFPKLEAIYGDMLQITVVERNAFWNLPSLKHVHLGFNSLKELRYGVFSSLPIETLDLSWNEIGYISETAFKSMNNLISLNLTHNRLAVLDLLQVDFPLKELLLSHNNIESVAINPIINLTVIDLSFNKLKKFDTEDLKTYKLIDLTGNYLSELILGSSTILNLKLGLNNLTSVTPLMKNVTKIKNVVLFPNPFDCNKVNELIEHLTKLGVKISKPNTDKRLNFSPHSYPVCAYQDLEAYEKYQDMRSLFIKHESIPCSRDSHCASFMICKNRQCWDPCAFDFCRKKNLACQTKNHVLSCRCPTSQFLNETQLFSSCYAVCSQDADCLDDEYCDESNICRKL